MARLDLSRHFRISNRNEIADMQFYKENPARRKRRLESIETAALCFDCSRKIAAKETVYRERRRFGVALVCERCHKKSWFAYSLMPKPCEQCGRLVGMERPYPLRIICSNRCRTLRQKVWAKENREKWKAIRAKHATTPRIHTQARRRQALLG